MLFSEVWHFFKITPYIFNQRNPAVVTSTAGQIWAEKQAGGPQAVRLDPPPTPTRKG